MQTAIKKDPGIGALYKTKGRQDDAFPLLSTLLERHPLGVKMSIVRVETCTECDKDVVSYVFIPLMNS